MINTFAKGFFAGFIICIGMYTIQRAEASYNRNRGAL